MIYADNAATTKISDAVLEKMFAVLKEGYGNASSIYRLGAQAKKILEESRWYVADALDAKPSEIYFTSGGTEADNWAIKGTASFLKQQGKTHIISSVIEHYAVLRSLDSMKQQGFEITLLETDKSGIVSPEQLQNAIKDETGLVSIMLANNEIGTIQNVEEFGSICRSRNVIFHTDAVQALGQIPVKVQDLHADLLSLSGHKIHAAKGIGVLYVREGTPLEPFFDGGKQERGLRAGTENVAAAAGFGIAVREAVNGLEKRAKHLSELRERFFDGLRRFVGYHINGDTQERLPGNVNVSFDGVEGESLLLMLDKQGICCSTGSACTSGSLDASHVLLALGMPLELARGSLRFTFSEENTENEIDIILDVLYSSLQKARAIRSNMPPQTDGQCCCEGGCG
ncbi:cysteine desulfurase NifS [Planctomycetales bacterium]|nr:cysteine desulfurase NifS [Planctomycetales bacterium]